MYLEARNKREKPSWIGEDARKDLLEEWNKPTYQEISKRNKKNCDSAKGGSLHTGGSITFTKHTLRMIRFSFCIFYNINWTNLSLKFWTVMIIVLCIWLLYVLRQTDILFLICPSPYGALLSCRGNVWMLLVLFLRIIKNINTLHNFTIIGIINQTSMSC
jgi:hypothetical protein